MSDDEDRDFLLPLRWKKKQPPKAKFTIADETTLTKILSHTSRRPPPEFKGKEYTGGIKSEDNIKLFKCSEPGCNGRFTNETSLKLHFNKHLDRQKKCSFCDQIFKTDDEKSNHLDQFHPDLQKNPEANPLQCKKCNKISRDKKALWRHVRANHRDQTYPCPQCNFQFAAPDNLKRHLKIQHPPEGLPVQKWDCDICGRSYTHKNTLTTHIKANHRVGESKRSFRCVLCDITYHDLPAYKRNMKRHTNPKFFPCKACNVQFRSSSHFNRHIGTLGHKKVVRKLGKNYSDEVETKVDTINAVKIETGNGNERTNQGGKTFTPEELIGLCKTKFVKIILHRVDNGVVRFKSKHHIQAVARKKGHYLQCIYCDLTLPDLEGVKKHEMICLMKIQNKKLHICPQPQCNKEFDKAYDLVKHSRVHSDERPFPCSHCDAKFKSKALKVQHEKGVHFGIRYKPKVPRVFCCNHQGCGKQFSTGKELARHVAVIHLGVRHPCKTCGKVFRRQEQLKKHVKEDHDKNPTFLLCKACKRTYKDKASMLTHLGTKRHKRKAKELSRQFGNKEEMTDVLSGGSSTNSSVD